jgi:hypothetical protein
MAQSANTHDRYDVLNNAREDLSDIIYNISPTEVPAQSNFGRGSSMQTFKEWQIDALVTAANNAAIDGDEFSGLALDKAERIGNYHQISRKDLVVSRRANIINKAGRKSEIAYQIAKQGKALRRDVEVAITLRKIAVEGNSTTAMQSAGIATWLRTNVNRGALGTAPTLSGSTEGFPNGNGTAGAARGLTELQILTIVRQIYDQGGNPDMVMLPPTSKQGLSTYLFSASTRRVATQFQDQGKNPRGGITVVGAVDVYVTDFCVVDIAPNRFSPAGATATEVYVLDTEFWEVAYLDGYKTETIAKIGDHERRMLLVDWTLCSLNEAASGVIADINDTVAVA